MGTEFDEKLVKIVLESPFAGPGLKAAPVVVAGPGGEPVAAAPNPPAPDPSAPA
jgi:hypothetical protein